MKILLHLRHVAASAACLLPLGARAQPARPPASAAATVASPEVVTLDEFTVSASPDDGYKATNVLSGTRFNTSLLDLPRPVDVVTREFMNDIGARDITEALQYVAGVTFNRETDSAAQQDTDVLVRGFSGGGGGVSGGGGNQYVNGYRTFGRFDNISIERIEVLKGPSSLFSGAIGAGGAINTVTRTPSTRPRGQFMASYGTFDRYRGSLEYSAPLTADRRIAFWMGLAARDEGSPYDFANYRSVSFSPAVQWNLGASTRVYAFAQWQHNEQVSASPPVFLLPGNVGYLPNVRRSFNRQGPESFHDSNVFHSTLDVTHVLNETWTLKLGGSYRHFQRWRNLVTGGTTATINAITGARTVGRSAAYNNQPETGYSLQPYVLGRFGYLGLTHRMILGAEYFSHGAHEITKQPSPNLTPINLDAPVSYALGDWRNYPVLRDQENMLISRAVSANHLWQTAERRVTLQLGYRREEAYQAQRNYRTPASSFSGKAKPANLLSGGAAYRILPRVAVFASYSESFEPLVKTDFFGRPFDPREGTGTDYGVRWDRADGRLSGTVNFFQVRNRNLEQSDPAHPGYQVQTGDNRAQGVEFSLNARPVKAWQVVGSYTYNRTRVERDIVRPQNVGLPTANAPLRQWSLWNRYRFEQGALKGLGAGLGVTFVGERRGNPNLTDLKAIRSPEYHKFQASLTYAAPVFGRRTTFALSGDNLLDRDYLITYAGYGEPRTVTGRLTFEF
jgi:iron complex outermembrane receptor protein